MKAILVIDDMPENCSECSCEQNGICLAKSDVVESIDRPSWCPLKPIPKKQEHRKGLCSDNILGFEDGWNDCLDAITGETE